MVLLLSVLVVVIIVLDNSLAIDVAVLVHLMVVICVLAITDVCTITLSHFGLRRTTV